MEYEKELEVFRQFANAQEKYDYFLMSVAAAAIAFAVHRTSGMSLDWFMIILGIAITLWAISFLAGCRRRNYIGSNFYANMDLLRVQNGVHPEVGMHPEKIKAASQGIINAMEHNSNRASFWANVQLHSLIIGAVIFIVWHAIEMAKINSCGT
jgi:hypothetical protein